jgi:hypothetical protein
MVGTSGKSAMRAVELTPSGRNSPALIGGNDVPGGSNINWM